MSFLPAPLPTLRPTPLLVDAENKVVQHPVQLGLQSGPDVEVLYGLTGNERLILANVSGFRPGQVVEAVQAEK